MKFKRVLATCLALLLLLSSANGFAMTARADDNPGTLRFYLQKANPALAVTPGTTFYVFVMVENNPGLCAASLQFAYNDSILEMVVEDPEIVGDNAIYPEIAIDSAIPFYDGATMAAGLGCPAARENKGNFQPIGSLTASAVDKTTVWNHDRNISPEDGYLLVVPFKVSENALNGTYSIEISRRGGDANIARVDGDGSNVDDIKPVTDYTMSGMTVTITGGNPEPITVTDIDPEDTPEVAYGQTSTTKVTFENSSAADIDLALSTTAGSGFTVQETVTVPGKVDETNGSITVDVTFSGKDVRDDAYTDTLTATYTASGISGLTATAGLSAKVNPVAPRIELTNNPVSVKEGCTLEQLTEAVGVTVIGADNSPLTSTGTCEWYKGADTTSAKLTKEELTATNTDIRAYLAYTCNESETNYVRTPVFGGPVTIKISAGDPQYVSVLNSAAELVYGDTTSHTLTASSNSSEDGTGSTIETTYTWEVLSGGDVITLTDGAGTTTKNFTVNKAGTAQIKVTGAAVTGAYIAGEKTIEIVVNKRSVTVSNIAAETREYNGTGDTSVELDVSSATITGLVEGDEGAVGVASASGTVGNGAVGSSAVTVSTVSLKGDKADNYTVGSATSSDATITAKKITVSGITANDKEYDAETTAIIDYSNATFAGVVDGETVSVASATGTFDNKNVGTNKTVTIAGITLGGVNAGNYELDTTQTVTTTANITAKRITITGVTATNRAYVPDKTAVELTGGALDGVISGDTVEFSRGIGYIADDNANVGENKAVTTNIQLDGTDKDNYTLTQPTDVTVNITKAVWPDDKKAAAGSARYGNSGEVDLADYIAEGATVAIKDQGITDTNGVLEGEPACADKKLSFKFNDAAVPESTATVVLAVSGATNYNDYELTITLTVNDKELDKDSMTIAQTGCTYGETLPNYTLTGEPTEEHTTTVLYTGTTRGGASYSDPAKPTEAGIYTVKVTCETADKVYEATSAAFTIAPANISGATVALGASLTYNGSEQTQDITSATLNGKDILPSSTVSGNTVTDAGSFKLTITANSSSNYEGTKEVNFTVAKATPVITGGTPATATGTYGINLKEIFLSNGPTVKLSANASSVVSGNWRFTDDVVLNAGTYEKQATFTPTVTKNINPVTTTVTVTINKATWNNTSNIGSAKYGNDGMVDLSNQLAAGYQVGTISVTDDDSVLAGTPVVTAGILKYKFVNDAAKVGKTATITIPVTSSTNYNAYNIIVEVTVLDKYAPVVAAENITVTYTGSPVSADLIKGTATHNGATVAGTWAFASGVDVTNVQSGSVEVIFTPTNTDDYATVSTTITLTINKATPSGAPVFEPVKEDGKTLGDIVMPDNLGGVPGTFAWADGDSTKIERGKEYQWTFTPTDQANYNSYIGTSIPWPNQAISVPTWHNIYVNVTGNGTAKTDVTKQKAGQPVVVTVTPDPGYKLGSLVVTDYNGNALALTREGRNTYSFTMPQMRAYVTANFVLEAFPFTDVPVDAWFRSPVEYVYENGIMGGIGGSLFAPDMTTTRGMIVTMLHRIEGCPVPKSVGTFTDVASNAYYAQAADWAAENGIVGGYGNGKFGPNDPIQREQMAAILYRYAQYKGMDAVTLAEYLGGFPDVNKVSTYAISALNWAVGAGIINGVGDKLMPQGNATRAQVAAMLMRFLTK